MEIFRKRRLFRASGADPFSDHVLRAGHESPVQPVRRYTLPVCHVACEAAVAWELPVPRKHDRCCFHNLGQIGVAFLLTSVPAVLVYLPFLLLSGLVTGLFIGLCARFTLRFLP